MRVFVTGGTGFIGSAVVRDLIDAGHDVLALARSEASAAALEAAGATAYPGSLEEAECVRDGAARSDAVIHTAFDNTSITQISRNSGVERAALRAIADALSGTDRPLVAAGGFVPVIASGPVFTKDDPASPEPGPLGRNVERTIMGLAEAGVNASIVRLPCVHGDGDHFTLPRFIELARKQGTSAYVGQGEGRFPAVHHTDAARVFRLAAERGVPAGRYHAVAEEGVPFRAIAEVIGRRLHVPTVGMPPSQARRHFGPYMAYVQGGRPASSTATRQVLGWSPQGPGLLADLDRPEYFTGFTGRGSSAAR